MAEFGPSPVVDDSSRDHEALTQSIDKDGEASPTTARRFLSRPIPVALVAVLAVAGVVVACVFDLGHSAGLAPASRRALQGAGAGNPFAGQVFYKNPANQAEYDESIATSSGVVKTNLQAMRDVPSAYWIDVKAKIRGDSTRTLQGILEDASSKSPAEMVTFIWYDLPNRDCHAKASNGEICCKYLSDGRCDYTYQSDCIEGLREYKETYADPFVEVLQMYEGRVPVAIVVEPDSLPNLATNADDPRCGGLATGQAYREGISYAVEQLTSRTPWVAVYLDAAHGGWLGWQDNLESFMETLRGMNLPVSKMRGFATNVANYQPLGELCPFEPDDGLRNGYCLNGRHSADACCADPCGLTEEWNPGNGELNYAQGLIQAASSYLDMDAKVIIDTGRNGVVGMREDCAHWCNIRGAGAGLASTVETGAPFVDAYFWLKTPGESDGCTEELPGGGLCPRFDRDCNTVDSIGSQDGEPRAPEAGHWFDYQVKQLAEFAQLG